MQSGVAPSSAMGERLVGDGRLRLSGRNDARCTGWHGIRGTRTMKPPVPVSEALSSAQSDVEVRVRR
jgi:hypothetical protein